MQTWKNGSRETFGVRGIAPGFDMLCTNPRIRNCGAWRVGFEAWFAHLFYL